jgi:hypothetical protein
MEVAALKTTTVPKKAAKRRRRDLQHVVLRLVGMFARPYMEVCILAIGTVHNTRLTISRRLLP